MNGQYFWPALKAASSKIDGYCHCNQSALGQLNKTTNSYD
jgi:hypothetical protein